MDRILSSKIAPEREDKWVSGRRNANGAIQRRTVLIIHRVQTLRVFFSGPPRSRVSTKDFLSLGARGGMIIEAIKSMPKTNSAQQQQQQQQQGGMTAAGFGHYPSLLDVLSRTSLSPC